MTQRIVVGTDGSDHARVAVEWAAEFARLGADVEVVLCNVIARASEWLMSAAQIDFQKVEKEHLRLLGGEWSEPLRNAGVKYETVLGNGDQVEELLRIAAERDADLLVIGKAGHGAAGQLLLGGIATKLAHRTTTPLLIVPPRRHPEPPEHDEPHAVPIPG
jgi:nucleotide-binding universal stress UspA family protein